MKELTDLRNKVLILRNIGEITKQTENILLNKLNALDEAITYAHSCTELNAILKKGDIIIYKNDLQGQVIEELENNKVEIKIIGYGILKVHKKHLELIPRSI